MKTACLIILLLLSPALSLRLEATTTLRFCLRSEPRTLHPLLVSDDASETIRYLTGGVLIRIDRQTQELRPGLAKSWKVSADGRQIDFVLRENIRFSDGTPFGPEDVAYTFRQVMNPELHAPLADSFDGKVQVVPTGPDKVSVRFPKPVSGLAELFDQLPMLSSKSPLKEQAVLGPFQITAHKPGVSISLGRNANYWERDAKGKALPYLDSIQIDIQQNREVEALRLKRGEIDLIQGVGPDLFDRMTREKLTQVRMLDEGPSLDSDLIWFNMSPSSPISAYKKAWFNDAHFRHAISTAIHRDDICRIVYRGHAIPAVGPVSVANKFWFNSQLRARTASAPKALEELTQAGFHLTSGKLVDRGGHLVEFSLISNAGNKSHEGMLAMMQQDLAQIGITLNVASLDFASVIDRITRSLDYEACLMSLTNVGLDPNEQMNVWMSSANNHQWNPNQKTPSTPWEARIDTLMRQQFSATDTAVRKKLFDEVQTIASEQEPFVYLVHPNVLGAISVRVRNVRAAALRPALYWNIESEEVPEDRK